MSCTVVPTVDFALSVQMELRRARSLHKGINSLHEGYAVLLEEVDELWREVKLKREDRDVVNILAELIQIGAMAQRIAEDVVIAKA